MCPYKAAVKGISGCGLATAASPSNSQCLKPILPDKITLSPEVGRPCMFRSRMQTRSSLSL